MTPIIKFEIESIKHTLATAINDHLLKLDQEFKVALDKECDPDNIRRILEDQVSKSVEERIREEVDNFFKYGEGKKIVQQKVIERLKSDLE